MNTIINLNKPYGISSQAAVIKVRKLSGAKKAGHAGTLDPIATGILLVCLGEATKISRFLTETDKEYIAVMKLGEKTDTLDSEGEVLEKTDCYSLGEQELRQVVESFKGSIHQLPPMFSAVKIGGSPLYKLARKGLTVERAERAVTIHNIKITGFDLPFLEIKVACSKGTYIRTLCNDIGDALGVGAHMTGLERTGVGEFRIEDSITLEELEAQSVKAFDAEAGCRTSRPLSRSISDIDTALSHMFELILTEKEFAGAWNGVPFSRPELHLTAQKFLRLKGPAGNLFAIGRVVGDSIEIERRLNLEV